MNTPLNHSFDTGNAGALAGACYRTYESYETHGTYTSAPTDTRVTLSCSDDDLVVAFRGTADLRNWLTDFDCEKMALVWSAGRVHRGFNLALASVAEMLDTAIPATETRRIWVTGHSLGGALAMLFALRLIVRRRMNVAGVYTFGQPRVGNFGFSLAYDALLKARTFRVVHADDMVPGVPWMLGTYHHAGHEVSYRGAGSFQVDPPFLREAPRKLIGLANELAFGKCALLSDHHIKHYLALFS